MTEKRFTLKYINEQHISANLYDNETFIGSIGIGEELIVELLNQLSEENEQLKKGMIGVVDRYIKNVECNPPSSARTYGKIKGALINIREDLRSLIGDFE